MRLLRRCLVLLLLCATAAAAPGRRDALTTAETDQLREVAQEPEKRIKLFIQFARARMLAIDQLRSDPNLSQGRGAKLHDLIEDLTNIVDELGDNLEMYDDRKYDIRKPLKEVVQALSELQLKVRAVKQATGSDPQAARESSEYEFALTNLVEAINGHADSTRELLDDQNASIEAAKQERKKKK